MVNKKAHNINYNAALILILFCFFSINNSCELQANQNLETDNHIDSPISGSEFISQLKSAAKKNNIPTSTPNNFIPFYSKSAPSGPQTFSTDHFDFEWNSADMNLNQIQYLSLFLEDHWYKIKYIYKFKLDMGTRENGKLLVDVYPFSENTSSYAGFTLPTDSTINLNSNQILTKCAQNEITAYLLLERVLYKYGFKYSFLNHDNWFGNGILSYLTKYISKEPYYIERMNKWLLKPDTRYLLNWFDGSAFYWAYFCERYSEKYNRHPTKIIKEVLKKFKKTKDAYKAVSKTIEKHFNVNFYSFAQSVHETALLKELQNVSRKYSIDEVGTTFTTCGKDYKLTGLKPKEDKNLNSSIKSSYTYNDVHTTAANFHVFNIGSGIDRLNFKLSTTSGKIRWSFIGYKNFKLVRWFRRINNSKIKLRGKNVSDKYDTIVIMAMGAGPRKDIYTKNGYSIKTEQPEKKIKGKITGTWSVPYQYIKFSIKEKDSGKIKGKVLIPPMADMARPKVTGNRSKNTVILNYNYLGLDWTHTYTLQTKKLMAGSFTNNGPYGYVISSTMEKTSDSTN